MNELSMKGKICLITGATSGVGEETAKGLAQMGATVVMIARNADKLAKVKSELIAETNNEHIDTIQADLSVQSEVHKAAQEFLARYENLHVLINNAGGVFSKRTLTADGFEYTFALNHLGYFLLTNLLLDTLKKSAPARIVNVSSMAHASAGKFDFSDLTREKSYNPFAVYSQSKLANALFTYELARRLEGTNVTANCLHPGFVNTGFGKNNNALYNAGLFLMQPIMISPQKGAETSIYLASSPEVEGVTGKYFSKKKAIPSSAASYDTNAQRVLWEMSEVMTQNTVITK